MLGSLIPVTVGVIGLFVAYLLLTNVETSRGRRFVLPRARGVLDREIARLEWWIASWYRYMVRYVITLSWYYGLHAFLKTILRFLAYLYTKIETVFIKNRNNAKAIRKERKHRATHLTAIAEHKVAVTLSSAEKRVLKEKSLRGR